MVELNMEHVLILVIAVFLLYHLINRCSNVMRSGNGFRVGSQVGGQEFHIKVRRPLITRTECGNISTHIVNQINNLPHSVPIKDYLNTLDSNDISKLTECKNLVGERFVDWCNILGC